MGSEILLSTETENTVRSEISTSSHRGEREREVRSDERQTDTETTLAWQLANAKQANMSSSDLRQ